MARKSDVDRDGNDTAVLEAVTKMLDAGIENMGSWLREPDQAAFLKTHRYLDEGTPERAYWHAGYVSAMMSLREAIRSRIAEYPMKDDTQSSSPS